MSLFRGENVFPSVVQFTPLAKEGDVPKGATNGAMWYDKDFQTWFCLKNNVQINCNNAGTVIGISVENLPPLFTAHIVDTPPDFSVPDIVFNLSSAAANTVFGNCTGLGGLPSYCGITPDMIPPLTAAQLNVVQPSVLDCTAFAGADMGAQINACIAALPASGGIANCNNFISPQTISTAVVVNKPVVVQTCGIAISLAANITLSSNLSAWRGCEDESTTFTQTASNVGFILSGQLVSLSYIYYNANLLTGVPVSLGSSITPTVDHCNFVNFITGVISGTPNNATISNLSISDTGASTGPWFSFTGGSGLLTNINGSHIGAGNTLNVSSGTWTISNSIIFHSGAAKIGINHTGGSLFVINNPQIQAGPGFAALSSTGGSLHAYGNAFVGNTDVIFLGSNAALFHDNHIDLATTSSSGKSGIHMKGDTIASKVVNNYINIVLTTPTGNSYGIWMDTSAGGHFLSHLVTGNTVNSGSGVKTNDVGIFFDNSSANATASFNSITNNSLVDIPAGQGILRTANTVSGNFYANNTGNTGFQMSVAGSTLDVVQQGTINFATLPTAQSGSLLYCTDCTSVLPVTSGGTGAYIARINSVWVPWASPAASGTATLTSNAALAAVTSQTAITVAGTGILTTDAIEWSYATAPTAGDSMCHLSVYVTAGNVNFIRTNPTAAAQNVSAIVVNWRVIR